MSFADKPPEFWKQITDKATELKSDGCTGVADFYKECCYLHDIYYRTHLDLNGDPITKAEADKALRDCIRCKSRFGFWNPMAIWRWIGVKMFAQRAWDKGGK